MSDFNQGLAGSPAAANPAVDAGLRSFMRGVYNKVGLGLVLAGALAYVTGNVPAVRDLLWTTSGLGVHGMTVLGMVIAFAPLAILMFGRFAMQQSPRNAAMIYWALVSLIGASLGTVFLRYGDISIAQTFLVTATAFGGLSLLGYTTKRDLSGMGGFLAMGLIGLIVAMFASFLFHSPMLSFIINILGVGIFAGFTAYDAQKLKAIYYQVGGDNAAMSVATSYGALNLFLDFI